MNHKGQNLGDKPASSPKEKLKFAAKETIMERKVRITVLLLGIFVLIWPGTIVAQKKKSVNERILEILIEKNIITKAQYEDLLKQAKEEESQQVYQQGGRGHFWN